MEIRLQKIFPGGGEMTRAGGVPGTRGQYPITLVTAYFELGGKPGWPRNNYPEWIRNFLPYVRWPLVIFCDEQSLDMLKEARGDKPAVWHVARPQDFHACRYLDKQDSIKFDAEDVFVTRSLIWFEKHHFLRQAMSQNPFGSEMFFWCDIGSFRYDPGEPLMSVRRMTFRLFEDTEWPNLEVCRALPKDKVFLMIRGYPHIDDIHGGFYGGRVEPLRQWCDLFYRCCEQRVKGVLWDDEEVMAVCCDKKPELAHVMRTFCAPRIKLIHKRWTGFRPYFLSGRRFPWKYYCRMFFSGPAR